MELRHAVDVFAFARAPPPTSVDDGASDSLRHGLDKALYKSQWSVAVRWLDENHLLDAEAEASLTALFQAGAKAFGLDWALSPTTLAPLLAAARDDRAGFKAAQAALAALAWPPLISGEAAPPLAAAATAQSLPPLLAARDGEPTSAASRRRRRQREMACNVLAITALLAGGGKLLLDALLLAFSSFWAPLTSLFGPAIIVGRVTAFGILFCTAVLFLTMSRGLHRGVHALCARWSARSRVLRALSHKEAHVFSAVAMVVLALIHTVAHAVWDLPTMLTADVSRLNQAMKCGICDTNDVCRLTLPRALEWPPCPFEAALSVSQLLTSTTVVTGVLLWLVLLAMWATAHRAARAARYDVFWLAHNALLVGWVVLLWLHASNQWTGAAFPFALWIVVPPAAVYCAGRASRAWQACACAAAQEQPPTVVFQAAPPDEAADEEAGSGSHERLLPPPAARSGELIRLTLPVSWRFAARCRPGMYAFLCAPELSSWQWHPFTIASFDGAGGGAAVATSSSTNSSTSSVGTGDEMVALSPRQRGRRDEALLSVGPLPTPTASFIIEVAGDWTASLVGACKQAHQRRGRSAMPRVVLDGPFPAPAQSALRCPVLLAVGAGIGITPFLSLIETLAERELASDADGGPLSTGLLEARCYWISRSAEAFLFGWPLLRKLLSHAQLRTRIVFHLHVTARAPEGNGAAYLFREAVARQNSQLHGSEARADALFVAVDDVVVDGEGEGGPGPAAGVSIEFGRPDFQRQLLALAARHPSHDVSVFACGGEPLVESLGAACEASERAVKDSTQQRFPLAHERFG